MLTVMFLGRMFLKGISREKNIFCDFKWPGLAVGVTKLNGGIIDVVKQ